MVVKGNLVLEYCQNLVFPVYGQMGREVVCPFHRIPVISDQMLGF